LNEFFSLCVPVYPETSQLDSKALIEAFK